MSKLHKSIDNTVLVTHTGVSLLKTNPKCLSKGVIPAGQRWSCSSSDHYSKSSDWDQNARFHHSWWMWTSLPLSQPRWLFIVKAQLHFSARHLVYVCYQRSLNREQVVKMVPWNSWAKARSLSLWSLSLCLAQPVMVVGLWFVSILSTHRTT